MNNLFNDIKLLTIGIRFKEMYKILDSWGSIADSILHDKSCFKENYFINITQNYTVERALLDKDNERYLKLTFSDLIFQHSIKNGDSVEEEFDWFKNTAVKFLIEKIIQQYNISTFSRVGIVYTHEIKDKAVYDRLVKKVVNKDIGDVNDIRFSIKSATPASLVLRGKDDYINKIYSCSIEKEETPFISFDYQYYMRPMISDIRECKIPLIINNSLDSLEKNLYDLMREDKNGETPRKKK